MFQDFKEDKRVDKFYLNKVWLITKIYKEKEVEYYLVKNVDGRKKEKVRRKKQERRSEDEEGGKKVKPPRNLQRCNDRRQNDGMAEKTRGMDKQRENQNTDVQLNLAITNVKGPTNHNHFRRVSDVVTRQFRN